LRLHVVQKQLTEACLSPSGTVWRNDDGGGTCPLCPLIKAATNTRGWYPLIISHWTGAAVNADFRLNICRYPAGNINCSSPTPPFGGVTAAELQKPSGAVQPIPGGTNSP
jgi:hypothetical protein